MDRTGRCCGDGVPLGTLCHFDLNKCESRTSDLQFLEMLAPLLQRTIEQTRAAQG